MKLRICFLLTLCVVGITGQSSPSTVSSAAAATAASTAPSTATPTTTTTAPTTTTTTTTAPTTTATAPTTTATAPTATAPTATAPTTGSPTATSPATSGSPTATPPATAGSSVPSSASPPASTGSTPAVPTQTSPAPTPTKPAPTTSPTILPTNNPVDILETGRWNITTADEKKDVCAIMEGTIYFKLHYLQTDQANATVQINVPKNASQTESSCAGTNETQFFILVWDSFTATFSYSVVGDDSYTLSNVKLDYVLDEAYFPHAAVLGSNNTVYSNGTDSQYKVTLKQSYRCDVSETIKLQSNTSDPGEVHLSNFKYMIYQTYTDGYSTAVECPDDFTTSDIVPIAVGCALAALVVIVLIAYLIGRRRSRQKGYQSV